MRVSENLIEILDPTIEGVSTNTNVMASRLQTLDDATIGLLSNRKHNADRLMTKIAEVLQGKYHIKDTVAVSKSHPSIQVDEKEIEILKRCDAVLTAAGD